MKNPEIVQEIDKQASKIHEAFTNERMPDEERYNSIKNSSRKICARFKDLKKRDGDGVLDFPEDTSLPFFAYGVFKPGEISYPRIEPYVKSGADEEEYVTYTLYERDGIPTVFKEKTDGRTYGYILTFKENDSEKAYNVIRKVESKTFYEWSKEPIYINEKPVNMLFGNEINKSRPEHVENSYHGVNDVFFKHTIPLILMDLENDDEIKDYNSLSPLEKRYEGNGLYKRINNFFRLQRNYVFLWAAIERYTSLKYGENLKTYNNKLLAEEEIFRYSLKYFVKEEDNKNNERHVFGTQYLDRHDLDPNNSQDAIKYYYTLRSNVVHRGKGSMGNIDERELRKSLFELLAIFQFILKDTFKEYKIIKVDDKISGIKINEEIWKDFKQKFY